MARLTCLSIFNLSIWLFCLPIVGLCETRNVVLIIVDGMHLSNEVAASRYLSGEDFGLGFHSWEYSAPVATWDINTYNRYAWNACAPPYKAKEFDPLLGYDPCLGGACPSFLEGDYSYFLKPLAKEIDETPAIPSADSASTGTAFATGCKTDRGNISWASGDQPGGELTTILELAKNHGLRTGVATTVPFSHATPASFAAHDVYRSNYQEIAHDMLFEVQPDLIIGNGWPDPAGDYKYISEADWQAVHQDNTYTIVEPQPGLAVNELLSSGAQQALETGQGLFGIFAATDGSFDAVKVLDNPGTPLINVDPTGYTLSGITPVALDFLNAGNEGFFLMLEQGDVDLGNHDNNYTWCIGAMYDAHLAAQAVIDWLNKPGNKATLENTLVVLVPDHTHFMRLPKTLGPGELPEQIAVLEPTTEPWAYHWEYPQGEVLYLSRNHTNELGNLYATGAGAELFRPHEGQYYPCTRIIDNTQVHSVLMEWLGCGSSGQVY